VETHAFPLRTPGLRPGRRKAILLSVKGNRYDNEKEIEDKDETNTIERRCAADDAAGIGARRQVDEGISSESGGTYVPTSNTGQSPQKAEAYGRNDGSSETGSARVEWLRTSWRAGSTTALSAAQVLASADHVRGGGAKGREEERREKTIRSYDSLPARRA
jgi:hypothetical protein